MVLENCIEIDDNGQQNQELHHIFFSMDCESLKKAAALLKEDNIVAFPTETVYGLGANALSSTAIEKIFQAKGRPADNPLIVHVSSREMLENLLAPTPIPSQYDELLKHYWPGPLTILVPKPNCIPESVTAGQPTVAVRMPAHPIARKLIEICGFPLAAPSANTSGRPSPTSASHVYHDLGDRVPLIIDGGSCDSGVESTVLDGLRSVPAILRPGGVTYEMIRKYLPNVQVYRKHFVDKELEDTPTTPGMKYRHYTPNADVIMIEPRDITTQRQILDECYRDCVAKGLKVGVLSSNLSKEYPIEIHLGRTGAEVAKRLFASLREMESRNVDTILVQGIMEEDEGMAVMNRVRKAASQCI
jgi:L-threonylcarbamoyladenylate synthase